MLEDIKGKYAMVTGASRGIGFQIALNLAKHGCNLILHSRNLHHTQKIVKQANKFGVITIAVEADFLDPSAVDKMLEDLIKKEIPIDIIYNNSAIMTAYCQNPWEVSSIDIRNSMEVNVISPIKICSKIVPSMLRRKWGRIVNITSGIANQPELIAYAISKAALDKYVKDFAKTLENTGVTMNLLDPGWVKTDLGGEMAPNTIDSIYPAIMLPLFPDRGESGILYRAQNYSGMELEDAIRYQKISKD